MCALNIVRASLYAAPPILCRILWTPSAFFPASSAPHSSHFEEQYYYWQCLLRKSCWLSWTPMPDPFNILRTIEISAVQITMHCIVPVQCNNVHSARVQVVLRNNIVRPLLECTRYFISRKGQLFSLKMGTSSRHTCSISTKVRLPFFVSIIIALGNSHF